MVIFTYMLNFLGHMNNLLDKKSNKIQKDFSLSAAEIEILLGILKDATCKIRDIEPLYRVLIKLQEQHKHLNSNE